MKKVGALESGQQYVIYRARGGHKDATLGANRTNENKSKLSPELLIELL